MRLTKIVTKQGDEGYTTLRNQRISKDDRLVQTLGDIDELNSALGVVLAFNPYPDIDTCFTRLQHHLFDFGGELHLPERVAITDQHLAFLDTQLQTWNSALPPLEEFILPRGTPAAATCHLARTICRRAERSLVALHRQQSFSNPLLLKYINRLSDLLFIAARILARENPIKEAQWETNK